MGRSSPATRRCGRSWPSTPMRTSWTSPSTSREPAYSPTFGEGVFSEVRHIEEGRLLYRVRPSHTTSLIGVDGSHVAWNVLDGCLHHSPVVGRGVDHRSVSCGYSDVGDAVAVLIEEHQVAGISVGGCPVSVLALRRVGDVHTEVGEHR